MARRVRACRRSAPKSRSMAPEPAVAERRRALERRQPAHPSGSTFAGWPASVASCFQSIALLPELPSREVAVNASNARIVQMNQTERARRVRLLRLQRTRMGRARWRGPCPGRGRLRLGRREFAISRPHDRDRHRGVHDRDRLSRDRRRRRHRRHKSRSPHSQGLLRLEIRRRGTREDSLVSGMGLLS